MAQSALPKFRSPPVVETVLGIQFEALPGFRNAHLGAFWQSLESNRWPHIGEVTPLDPQFERFGAGETWGEIAPTLSFSRDLSIRLQIRNAHEDRMIQVQNGRLHYNWLGRNENEYPSYEAVKSEFDETLQRFQRFLSDHKLGDLRPNQWEVTYVNHIPKGGVWEETNDWPEVFPTLVNPRVSSAPIQLESFGGEWHFEIKPQKGRLHVRLGHGRREKPTPQEVMMLNLTARGPVPSNEAFLEFDNGLALGHEAIVRGFKDLTSEKAHQYWEIIND